MALASIDQVIPPATRPEQPRALPTFAGRGKAECGTHRPHAVAASIAALSTTALSTIALSNTALSNTALPIKALPIKALSETSRHA